MRRPPAIRSSRFSFFTRLPTRACSPSITRRGGGVGISSAFAPRATPTMSWTSWSGSSTACRRNAGGAAAARLPRQRRRHRDAFDRARDLGGARSTRRFGKRSALSWSSACRSAYKFVHDRVQEAAYSLIPEARARQPISGSGGCSLAHTPPEKREETIFEIVGQLDRGAALITSRTNGSNWRSST